MIQRKKSKVKPNLETLSLRWESNPHDSPAYLFPHTLPQKETGSRIHGGVVVLGGMGLSEWVREVESTSNEQSIKVEVVKIVEVDYSRAGERADQLRA